MTKQEILSVAIRQSAVDCSCSEDDFQRSNNVIVESLPAENGSRYMAFPQICALFSYGSNIVASCRQDLIPEVTAFINGTDRIHRCFETPAVFELNRIVQKANAEICWMHTCYLPDPDLVYRSDLFCPYETRELYPEDFTGLYLPQWSNALCSDRKELDMLGYGAYDGEKLIGFAGCSADCPEMWQIGIDVLPEYRRQGIAPALTNLLARAVFERNKIPFYAAAWSNIRSVRNALKSGFKPAWVAMCANKVRREYLSLTNNSRGDSSPPAVSCCHPPVLRCKMSLINQQPKRRRIMSCEKRYAIFCPFPCFC